MERYFKFDNINTWYDWGLIVTAKDVTPPEPKTNYVELDGMSGSLDLSESLSGEISYKDRTVTATFWTNNGTRKDRTDLLKKITTTLHGKKVKIVEPDDLDHYFIGRISIKSVTNILPYLEFSIEATCEPWRYSLEETKRTISLFGDQESVVISNNGIKTLCPTISVIGEANIFYGDNNTLLYGGNYKISDIKLKQGITILDVYGLGGVTFTYREADL